MNTNINWQAVRALRAAMLRSESIAQAEVGWACDESMDAGEWSSAWIDDARSSFYAQFYERIAERFGLTAQDLQMMEAMAHDCQTTHMFRRTAPRFRRLRFKPSDLRGLPFRYEHGGPERARWLPPGFENDDQFGPSV